MQDRCYTRFDLKIALPRHVRLDDRASPRGDSSLGFSFAIPSPGCTPFRSYQVEPSYLPTYPVVSISQDLKRLLQVGQNWKVELRISFRSFRVIQLARVRARVLYTRFIDSPRSLFSWEFIKPDLIPENRVVYAK